METLLRYLKNLDLSEIEAKLYIALLENGPRKVKDLADLVGLKRTTAYLHLDSLIDKGLAAEVMRGASKQIEAAHPERLKYLVEKKMQTAISLQKTFPGILRSIETMEPKRLNIDEPDIKYFKGINSVKAIYEEALNSNEFRAYVYLAEPDIIFPDNISVMNNAFKKNKRIKIKEIVDDSAYSRKETQALSANSRYSYKFMPTDLKLTAEDILIYDGNVAIINFKDKISGEVIHNIDYYNNSKELFDFIWKILPEVNLDVERK